MLRNLTLSAMAPDDLVALRPHLVERVVARGEVLIPQGHAVEVVHFPITAWLANTITLGDGQSIDTFVMGVEGVSGLAPFMANAPCAWGVEARAGGEIAQIPASILRARLEKSLPLQRQLLRLTSDYQAQAAINAACAAHHKTTQRLASMLLQTSDRIRKTELRATQEDLADILGYRRTTLVDAAQDLKEKGAITYSRGIVRITDRLRLSSIACECYGYQKALLAPLVEGDVRQAV